MSLDALIQEIHDLKRRVQLLETNESIPIAAHYGKDSGTIANNTVTIVNFDNLIYDTWSAVTTGAGWVFTVPIGGYYLVIARVGFEPSAQWGLGDDVYIDVNLEGAHYAKLDDRNDIPNAAGIEVHVSGSAVVEAAKDDEINVVVYQNSGATQTIETDEHTYIWIIRVG
jgi:hypothetical protein